MKRDEIAAAAAKRKNKEQKILYTQQNILRYCYTLSHRPTSPSGFYLFATIFFSSFGCCYYSLFSFSHFICFETVKNFYQSLAIDKASCLSTVPLFFLVLSCSQNRAKYRECECIMRLFRIAISNRLTFVGDKSERKQ